MLRRLTAVVFTVLTIATLTVSPALAAGPVPRELKQIEGQVTRIRGLSLSQPIKGQLLTRQEWRQRVRDSAAQATTENSAEIDTGQRLLVLLGYVAPDTQDVFSQAAAVQESSVEGFYEAKTKTLNVILNGPKPTLNDRLTYAHEYTHALQDERFGIRELTRQDQQNNDQTMAIRSLIEGDATLTMVLWARQNLTPQELSQLAQGPSAEEIEATGANDLPPVIIRSMAFPYNEGALFVASLYRQGGFPAVDAAFENPPLSTAEIFHPDRYLAGLQPVDASFPRVDNTIGGGPWFEIDRDTMGELDLRVLIEQFTDARTAERATTGWTGDEYALMTNVAGQDLYLLRTIWDDEHEAAEFAQAFSDAIWSRYGGGVTAIQAPSSDTVLETPDGGLTIRQTGAEVYLSLGPATDVTTEAVDAIAPVAVPVREAA